MRAFALLAAFLISLSCTPPRPPMPDTFQEHPLTSEVEVYPIEVIPPLASPDQQGFTYCCGNRTFKLQISCNQGIKRCYENTDGRWSQTYGRHCKKWLGETCYLQTCERVCDRERL